MSYAFLIGVRVTNDDMTSSTCIPCNFPVQINEISRNYRYTLRLAIFDSEAYWVLKVQVVLLRQVSMGRSFAWTLLQESKLGMLFLLRSRSFAFRTIG